MRNGFKYLNGIRGLASLNVILCHFVCGYFPQMYYQSEAERVGGLLSHFATGPLTFFVNGNVGVQFFFILTGFLVGNSTINKDSTFLKIRENCLKRYFRLFPVVASATIFTFF